MSIQDFDLTQQKALTIFQYKDSSVLQRLISNFLALGQKQFINSIAAFERGLALENATGWFLDRIGDNHGLPRPSVSPDDIKYFGFDLSGKNFEHPFFFGTFNKLQPMNDDDYRTLLRVWIRGLFYRGSTYELITILNDCLDSGCKIFEKNLNIVVHIFGNNIMLFRKLCQLAIPRTAGISYEFYLKNSSNTYTFNNFEFGASFVPKHN